MSSFFVLNNVVAPALPLWGQANGRPTKFIFWEDLTSTGSGQDGGPEPKQGFTGANCAECPDDNGDSWTVESARDVARGAHIFIEVVGKVNMAEVVNRLRACKENQKRVMELSAGGPTHGPSEHDTSTPFAKPGQTLNQQPQQTKAERKAAKKEQE